MYTTDVVAERVEFLEWGDKKAHNMQKKGNQKTQMRSTGDAKVQEVKDEDIYSFPFEEAVV